MISDVYWCFIFIGIFLMWGRGVGALALVSFGLGGLIWGVPH